MQHKKVLVVIVAIIIILLIILAINYYLFTGKKKIKLAKQLYEIYGNEQTHVLIDDTIYINEGETWSVDLELKPTVHLIVTAFSYEEDMLLLQDDEIEIIIYPPPEVKNIDPNLLYHHYDCAGFGFSTVIGVSNYMNYKLIRASSPENAFDYFYSHVNLSYGSGNWQLEINYIGDGLFNLDRGGELHVYFAYTQIIDFDIRLFEGELLYGKVHEAD